MSRQPLVFVALSGGVDSAVAAAMLLEQGYQVVGVTMRLWTKDEGHNIASCCSVEGADDARSVCQTLGIPFYILNFEAPFQTYVVDYFIDEYYRGRTPNPCLACNRWLKFDLLLRKALALGANCLATGHYARIQRENGGFCLLKGVDPTKDQSYVLYTLSQQELPHMLFPLGGYTKVEVRRKAAALGLPVAHKAESQEICFVPDGGYAKFLEEQGYALPGDILDSRGQVLGQHEGLFRYTIGQRRGLGVSRGQRLYVTGIDVARNALTLGTAGEMRKKTLLLSDLTFVASPPKLPTKVSARLRYHAPEVEGVLEPWGDMARLCFSQPQPAPAPGQAAVFYHGEEVLGGGTVEAAI